MKKIININLSGRVIPIEDAAYETLQRYIESLRRYFAQEEGRDEIINDIESRIAELMNDKVRKGATAITEADMDEIIASMGRVEDFEEADAAEATRVADAGETVSGSASIGGTGFTYKAKSRLYRDTSDKLLGGVCSGIANYMNVDPAIVRLLFAIITFGGFGMGILIYILLWIVLPSRDLEAFVGKRLFRNPDDRVISGVAGGLGAYFDKPSWAIRLIFAAPLLLNIVFSVINSLFSVGHRDLFPNLFIGSFTGTFSLAYIILWIVLPEARSPFEKMEMRGEKVDVNRIRQNVKEGMSDIKTRMESWGEEVKTSAQEMSRRATEFAQSQGRPFVSEVGQAARPAARGALHVIGVLFKAFFIFVAGCITLGLFVGLIMVVFGGVAFWPINNFLWTSPLQKFLAWGTLLLFIGVPIIGFITWMVRRIGQVRSRNRYLGWTFGGLWTLGWVCAISFAASIAKDLRVYDRANAIELPVNTTANKLLVRVNEPEIRYSGTAWWMDNNDNAGWDISDDVMKYNNVKIRINKSEDSFYRVKVYKYSAGRSLADVQARATQTRYEVSTKDSILNLASGLVINRESKFRGQGVIVEIEVPVGKMIRFDETLLDAYNPWVVRTSTREYRSWGRRRAYQIDWDFDEHFNWDIDTDYVMTSDGKLRKPAEVIMDNSGVRERVPTADSLRLQIEQREEQLEKDRERLRQLRREQEERRNNNNDDRPITDSETTARPTSGTRFSLPLVAAPFIPLLM
jgi:phage shock protein PspC (stress-responsive transcriptional regulator)/ElaB/YqjD/DUF883 family membrane-anchored ribosome-binding protein